MSKQPIDFLLSPYRKRALSILLLRPEEQFHVRELARLTDVSPGSLHRELKAMAEAGMLTRETRGNQVLYSADRTCPIYEELASILRKTVGLATQLADALTPLDDRVEMAFIFGSMAAGTSGPGSDLDVCVLGDVVLFDVVKALGPVGESLGIEINPVVMFVDQFQQKSESGDVFASRLIDEPKIFLKGGEDEFAGLVQDSAP